MIVCRSKLEGRVSLSGAKNAALKMLAASLLTSEPVVLCNYPSALLDAQVHVGMLQALGKEVEVSDTEVRISEQGAIRQRLDWDGRSIRNTLLILGALTARLGSGSVPLPGGCNLGDRKYDLHVMVLENLGAKVWEEEGRLCAEAPVGLHGADIRLPIRSTGATENAILVACLAKGTTRIWNPHIRPEILDLIALLHQMGADITVFGQEHIRIVGSEQLFGAHHTVIPDNMEALTWLVAAAITGGDIEIEHFPITDLEVVLTHLRSAGARIYQGDDSLIVRGGSIYPLEVSTGPHPGINSDMQPILAAWAAYARGESRLIDLRFPGRYGYAEEMRKMGVAFEIAGDVLRISGKAGQLTGATVRALDLRAGAALMLCGLGASGETVIQDAWQIERGYMSIDEKIRALGGHIIIEQ